MSFDLHLEFSQKPQNLERVLVDLGFTLDSVSEPDKISPVRSRSYKFIDNDESEKAVWVTYYDGLWDDVEENELWQNLAPHFKRVASATLITYMGRNAFDMKKQLDTAKFLRDHYKALLYDPQKGKIIK